jgi:Ca2+-transporting ATPase
MEEKMFEQQKIEEVLAQLSVDSRYGLSSEEAAERLRKYGPNTFREKKPKTKLQMFLSQLRDPMIYILFGAVFISLFLKEISDAASYWGVILLNAVIGMITGIKAENSLRH